jgi:hypothetical protein
VALRKDWQKIVETYTTAIRGMQNGTAGLWNRVNDNTPADKELNWAIGWAKVTGALVDKHQYGCATANLS